MFAVGQVLEGRFKLLRRLGKQPVPLSTFASGRQTWLAEDRLQEPFERVVIKFQVFEGARQWDDLKLFEREAQILKQLNHPRIPQYRQSFHIKQPRTWLGLIQDYIPGRSLQAWMDQGYQFTEQEIYDIAAQILEVLVYLHELKPPVLHRDLKPSNLIWTASHQIYVVDFGSVQRGLGRATGAAFTVVGTYGYTPMEQFGGQAVPASDLYALGACLGHFIDGEFLQGNGCNLDCLQYWRSHLP
ncbi:MAG: serine/threonine protein kinase [Acaryochloridaceae cyanobacterium SU_2_1]|nr:serine/threonine protein kinase [Acaryochloridaceae cyanobacterium SU_2_1]